MKNLPLMIDKFLTLFKWPVATLMVILLPAAINIYEVYPQYIGYNKKTFLLFLAGFCAFFAFKIFQGGGKLRTHFEITAHELTHIFFAKATFHKVTDIKVNDDGGEMSFEGIGNWLIVIAPYFFPLFCFFLMFLISVLKNYIPADMHYAVICAIGFFAGYHANTVIAEIHPEQTDLKIVTYPFCLMFLPAANLISFASIMAFANNGWAGVEKVHILVFKLTFIYAKNLLSFIF